MKLKLMEPAVEIINDAAQGKYAALRIVSAALDELEGQLEDSESRVLERYGTELLELLHQYQK